MENKAKIRINLSLREFEIEGSEDFINSHTKKIESFLEILKTSPAPVQQIVQQTPPKNNLHNPTPKANMDSSMPETFGEYFHGFPKSIKDGDKLLAAGYFAQSVSDDASFATSDATALLLEQGIKLSNPAVFIKNNIDVKRLIKLGKNKFKISADGVDHLQQIGASSN